MIMPPGHGLSLRARRVWSRREKRIVVAVGGLVTAIVVGVLIAVIASEHSTGNGCVSVAAPSVVGGSEIYKCGEPARALCRSVDVPGGYRGSVGAAIATECRKVGLPVG